MRISGHERGWENKIGPACRPKHGAYQGHNNADASIIRDAERKVKWILFIAVVMNVCTTGTGRVGRSPSPYHGQFLVSSVAENE